MTEQERREAQLEIPTQELSLEEIERELAAVRATEVQSQEPASR